ncbi:MAG: N-acetylmuramoyl-L-alanine amidase [Firmicutes bacterium]|nr:N-acetylmuramoyl-L-alanine amidase [Bacillota bacterium]
MNVTVVVRNRASIPVPADSLAAWRVVCQALGHRLFWDESEGVLHVDSHLDGWIVILDPAHGGVDRGGRGPAGHSEAQFALDVAMRAAPRFSRLGATVVLTRHGDDTVSPAERIATVRAAAGRGAGPSLFISLHTSPSCGEHRVEVVYHLAGWTRARHLADHVGRWLSRQTQLPYRTRCCLLPGSEEGYGSMLWLAGARFPFSRALPPRLALLTYLGNHGDVLGESRLADPAFREACAQGLLLGVLDFLIEYPLERREGMRLLEPTGPSPFLATPPPSAPTDAAPAPPPSAPTDAAPAPPPSAPTDAAPAPPPVTPSAPASTGPATSPPAPGPASAPAPGATVAVPPRGPAPASVPGAPAGPAGPAPQVPRVVGGSVVVPGPTPGYVGPARVTASVQVPASWPPAASGAAAAGTVRPPTPSGQVPVRQPFG